MKVFLPLARPMSLYMGHLLFEYFETVIYFKPSLNLTSSEIYLIGKGYKTIPGSIRENILALHKNKMNIKDILPNLHNEYIHNGYIHKYLYLTQETKLYPEEKRCFLHEEISEKQYISNQFPENSIDWILVKTL
jgi:hypothetical protein